MINNEIWDSKIENRAIEVIAISNNEIDNLIEFKETWFIENDLLENINDINHDIELIKEINNRVFTYIGKAKKGQKFRIKEHLIK